jgi:hypothetical protein
MNTVPDRFGYAKCKKISLPFGPAEGNRQQAGITIA